MNTELSFGQKYDDNGLIMPWFTHPALDEIKSMDLSDKNILMFGAGRGDLWLAKRCKKLSVVERNNEWIPYTLEQAIDIQVINNVKLSYYYRPCNDSSGMDKYYLEIPEGFAPDIIISDDAYRTEAVKMAIDYFKSKEGGGILICDNFWQDYVWKSPIAIEWLEPFEKHIHSQPDHKDFENEGCEWKTAIIFIK